MKSMIDNEHLLKEESHDKKLRSALNRIAKACKDVEQLGYFIYVAEHGSINVMNVEGAGGYKNNFDLTADMVVASVQVSGVDCGAW